MQLLDFSLMMLDGTSLCEEHGRKTSKFRNRPWLYKSQIVYLDFWTSEIPYHWSWIISQYLLPNTFLLYEILPILIFFPGKGVTTCGPTGFNMAHRNINILRGRHNGCFCIHTHSLVSISLVIAMEDIPWMPVTLIRCDSLS